MVTHAYNPSYAEGIGRRIMVPGLPKRKVRSYLKKNNPKQKGQE
jgi:hypothetical protein